MLRRLSTNSIAGRSLNFFRLGHLSRGLASSAVEKPFDKILIANRGEIACRIIRTARKLGVKTVAVYSDVDASSLHVRMADEAYCIGTAASKDSYLRMDRILEVAQRTGAQGIHPGYGFLSENAIFADKVEAAGIAFIGPSSFPMSEMGDKLNSKRIARAANCYVIPGFEGEVIDDHHAIALAREVGYPVMIKASAGGGGKGMRVARSDEEVREGFRLSKNEAMSSFGDDRMLIERFVENPHHIEIQVLADSFGNVVAFPERECSVQRRNQKVVEESPSCLVHPSTRRAMQKQAIALCRAVGYRSAGTIEMLCDEQQNFFFLEMNTRLQVEHPVTELVSGEDLVEHMLWIAAGKALPDRLLVNNKGEGQDRRDGYLDSKGYAIESRVYAEDPVRNFLPAIGPLVRYIEPKVHTTSDSKANDEATTIRVDSGVYEGGAISPHYDPMIAKLCSHHSHSRDKAIEAMNKALDEYVIRGVANNLAFLRAVYRDPVFNHGLYSTKFIAQQFPRGFTRVQLEDEEKYRLLAVAAAIHCASTSPTKHQLVDHNGHDDNSEDDMVMEKRELVLVLNDDEEHKPAYKVTVSIGQSLTAIISPMKDSEGQGIEHRVSLSDLDWSPDRPIARATFTSASADEDESCAAAVQLMGRSEDGDGLYLRLAGSDHHIIIRSPLEHSLSAYMKEPPTVDYSRSLLSPMPGTLVALSVKEGQRVEIGQQLAVVEAMKMQNVLKAQMAGIVKVLKKKVGQPLKVDEVILELEE